jgi:hypothetical protein
MARGFSATVVNTWLDSIFGTTWVKLHVGDPGAAGASNAAAGDTTRKQATMGAAAAGVKAMTGTAGPWTHGSAAGAGTESLSDVSLWSASTAGTFNASGAMGTLQSWSGTNTFVLNVLSVSATPVAA